MKHLQNKSLTFLFFFLTSTFITQAQMSGTIDSSFATNGVLILQPNTIGTDVANGMVVLPNDNVLLAGSTETGFLLSDAAVYRILPNGDVDPTFGVNGVSIFDCGGTQDYVHKMKVLPNGKMIIAGGVYDGGADVNFFAARLTENGFPDPTFGNNGVSIIPNPMGVGEDVANAIAIQPDGKIILAGAWAVPGFTDNHTTLVRLNENGTVDSSFGANGIVNVTNSGFANDLAFDILLLSDGSMITTGYADVLDQRVIIEKFNSSGILDPAFGTNGIAIFNLTTGQDVGWGIELHPNGRIMIAGRIGIGGPGKSDFLLMAITSNGALDTSFGIDGLASKNVNVTETALDLLVEPSGKIVLAGASGTGGLGGDDYAICRFNENGSIDATFGNNGATVSEIASFFSEAAVIGMQSDGKLMVAGRGATIKNDFALVRYFSDPIIIDCAAPINAATSNITSNSATLSWDNPGNADAFQVKYRTINDQGWTKMYVNNISVTITGLTAGSKYVWTVKAKCGADVSSVTNFIKFKTLPQRLEDAAIEVNNTMQLYPNPSTGNFQLSFNTGENMTATSSIQIVNIFGHVIDSRNADIVDGNLEEVFNLSNHLASGTYFIRLSVNDKVYHSRFILQ